MGRSPAWVYRGDEYVEARPMNWGANLTMIGAMRHDRWLTLSTAWKAVNAHRFVGGSVARWPRACGAEILSSSTTFGHTRPRVSRP